MVNPVRASDLKVGRTYRGHKILDITNWYGGPVWGTPHSNSRVHYMKGYWEQEMSVHRFLGMVNR